MQFQLNDFSTTSTLCQPNSSFILQCSLYTKKLIQNGEMCQQLYFSNLKSSYSIIHKLKICIWHINWQVHKNLLLTVWFSIFYYKKTVL